MILLFVVVVVVVVGERIYLSVLLINVKYNSKNDMFTFSG